jgi:hypothetical protein
VVIAHGYHGRRASLGTTGSLQDSPQQVWGRKPRQVWQGAKATLVRCEPRAGTSRQRAHQGGEPVHELVFIELVERILATVEVGLQPTRDMGLAEFG